MPNTWSAFGSRAKKILGASFFVLIPLCYLGYYGDLSIMAIQTYLQSAQLLKQGVITDGFVSGLRSAEVSDYTAYYIAYRFAPAGGEREFFSEQEIRQETYLTFQVGLPVKVRYLVSNPETSRLESEFRAPTFLQLAVPVCFTLVGVPFILVGITVFISAWHSQPADAEIGTST